MPDSEPLVLFRRVPSGLDRRAIEAFARKLSHRVAGGRAFYCLIAGDALLQRLNRRFLEKNYPTDVLSFPAGRGAAELGELAISAQRARTQAREFGHTIEEEIRILMLHGVLHLTGMDHEGDRGAMARAENAWRKKLGLPAGLIERVSA
jgi:probable rRNA maturation factor